MDLSSELNGFVDRATDNLLLKDFVDCRYTCLCGITRAKQFIEDERAQDCIERLCVLCIQALAEMNKWQDVLPLIQDVYNNIELCPSLVIQLCILLHARVKEYSQCHALASLWLRNEDNSYKPGYDRVAALYIEHVMLPQDRFLLVPQFLNSCTFLTQDMKDKMLKHCEKLNVKLQEDSKSKNTETSKEKDAVCDEEEPKNIEESESSIMKHMKYFGCLLASKLSFPAPDILWKIAVAIVSCCVLAKIYLKGNSSLYLGKLTLIWQYMLTTLKAIFTPYRPGR
ncbi:peroxisome assembly protein 26-like [Ruditapes philippinarum]|uniref:peroxisome assembly protein 26-like n=1 Tax=Ruditapes philippinarum TaxID=129788 RepID=UPI00295BD834|nr:peroxisome assembly protein 26-like [Ruditapes philippinarum]